MPTPTNPLLPLHEQAEAELQPYGDLPIVSTFGQPQAEYAAIRKGAAVMDWPQRSALRLTGRDRLSFLNNLITNQTYDKSAKAGIPAGSAVYAFFLNAKGRIVCDLTVVELGDEALVELDVRFAATLAQTFDKYLFSEQVKVEDRTGAIHELLLTGPAALGTLRRAADGADVPDLAPGKAARIQLLGHDVVAYRDDVCGVPGFVLLMDVAAAAPVWQHFARDPDKGEDEAQFLRFTGLARPVGWAAFNATRIEAGRPLYGVDIDDSILPAETGPATLARAVSFTKGCYLGQEIVARMQSRGQWSRQLVGIRMEGDELPVAGSKVYDAQQNEVGGITSSTVSPTLSNAPLCLGYVKRPHFAEGTTLHIPAEGAVRAGKVVELPFLKQP